MEDKDFPTKSVFNKDTLKKGKLTKVLATAGTVLVWLPMLFTVATSFIGTVYSGAIRFDYLMPAELFPVALIGALLLLWAAFRSQTFRGLIGWGLGSVIVFLIGGQAVAVISGLASGAVEPAGWVWALVIASIVIYSLLLIELGITGIMLLRKLFAK